MDRIIIACVNIGCAASAVATGIGLEAVSLARHDAHRTLFGVWIVGGAVAWMAGAITALVSAVHARRRAVA